MPNAVTNRLNHKLFRVKLAADPRPQIEVALAARLPASSLANYLAGRACPADRVARLEVALGLSPGELTVLAEAKGGAR